jgi:dihydroneopterin aldolase
MKVYIKDLSFKAILGILPFERVKKQSVLVNITFEYKFSKVASDFIDYSHVASIVKKTMKKEKFLLIEDAILNLDKQLNKRYALAKLKIKISKPTILKDCVVSVSN